MWWVRRLVRWICRLIRKNIHLWVFLTHYALKFIWERRYFSRIAKMEIFCCKRRPDVDEHYDRMLPAQPLTHADQEGATSRSAEIATSSKSITVIDTKTSKHLEKKTVEKIHSANTLIVSGKNRKSSTEQQSKLDDAATPPEKLKRSREANQSDKLKSLSEQKQDPAYDSANFQNSVCTDAKGNTSSKQRNSNYEKKQPKLDSAKSKTRSNYSLSQDLEQKNGQMIKAQVLSCNSNNAIYSNFPSSYNAGHKTNSQGNDSLPPSKILNLKMQKDNQPLAPAIHTPRKNIEEALYKADPHKEHVASQIEGEKLDKRRNHNILTEETVQTMSNQPKASIISQKLNQSDIPNTELIKGANTFSKYGSWKPLGTEIAQDKSKKHFAARTESNINEQESPKKCQNFLSGELDSATKEIAESLNNNKSRQEPLSGAKHAGLPLDQNDDEHIVQNELEGALKSKEEQKGEENTTLVHQWEQRTITFPEQDKAAKEIEESLDNNKSRQEPLNGAELASPELPSEQNDGTHDVQNKLEDSLESKEVQTSAENATFSNHCEHGIRRLDETDKETKEIDESLNNNKSRQEPLSGAKHAGLPLHQNDDEHIGQNELEGTLKSKEEQKGEENATLVHHWEQRTITFREQDKAAKEIEESLDNNKSRQEPPNGEEYAYALLPSEQNDNEHNVQTELEDTLASKVQNGEENTTCRNQWDKDNQAVDNTTEVGQIKNENSQKSSLQTIKHPLQINAEENTDSDTVLEPESIEKPGTELHRGKVLHELDEIKNKAEPFSDEIDKFTELEHSNKHYYIDESLRRLMYRLDDMYDEVGNDESLREERKKVYKIMFRLFRKLDDKTDQNRLKQANEQTENDQEQVTVVD